MGAKLTVVGDFMRRTIARALRKITAVLGRVAERLDPVQRVVVDLDAEHSASGSTSYSSTASHDTSGTVAADQKARAPTATTTAISSAAIVDMNVTEDARTAWAELFLDWMYDNAPCRDQLTGAQIKALAVEFNRWARVIGPPPHSAYLFKVLRRVGIEAAAPPGRDQGDHVPGRRRRRRLYALPIIEPEALPLAA